MFRPHYDWNQDQDEIQTPRVKSKKKNIIKEPVFSSKSDPD